MLKLPAAGLMWLSWPRSRCVVLQSLQVERFMRHLRSIASPLEKYVLLSYLKEDNLELFIDVAVANIAEIMPLVYTPVVRALPPRSTCLGLALVGVRWRRCGVQCRTRDWARVRVCPAGHTVAVKTREVFVCTLRSVRQPVVRMTCCHHTDTRRCPRYHCSMCRVPTAVVVRFCGAQRRATLGQR